MPVATRTSSEFARSWPVLLAATLGCATGLSSLPFYSLGVLIAPLEEHFGWGRGAIGSGYLYSSVTLALLSPLLGYAVDRLGPRTVALVSSPLLALALLALSFYEGPLGGFFALYALAALVGCGTTPVSYTRSISFAFRRRRGLALGITIGGIGVVAIILPPLLQTVIASYGWRGAYRLLALLAIAPWPILLMGLPKAEGAPAKGSSNLTDALTSRVFWTIGIGFTVIAVAVSGLTVHIVPLMRDSGMEPMRAAGIASLIGVGVLAGRIGVGFLIDHYFAPRVAVCVTLGTVAGCTLLLIDSVGFAPIAAVLIGLSLGAEVDLISFLAARYFGLARYGSIYALLYAAFLIGAATGPALAGTLFDVTGAYRIIVAGAIVLLLIGAMAAATLPRFPTPAET